MGQRKCGKDGVIERLDGEWDIGNVGRMGLLKDWMEDGTEEMWEGWGY